MATLALTGSPAIIRQVARSIEAVCVDRGQNQVITITIDNAPVTGTASVTGPNGNKRTH